jgi:uncharacterized peroxidase-related enzyme
MRIQPVEKDEAPDVVRRIYEALEQRAGSVSDFTKMLAHKPEVLRAFNQLFAAVMAEDTLPRRLKELAFLRVSILNGCAYCVHSHTASGKRRGLTDEQIAALKEPGAERQEDLFTAEERAILRFADLLRSYPGNITPEDLDALAAYLSEEQIIALVLTVATASWTNIVNDGLQTPVPHARQSLPA